jgi:quercetin dioxygenase-like cupin family protein
MKSQIVKPVAGIHFLLVAATNLLDSQARFRKAAIAIFIAMVSTAAGAAIFTPGAGVQSAVQARASFVDPVDIKFKIKAESENVISVLEARENVVQQIIIAPRGHTGWHSHPGPVVVLIKSGAMSLYSADDPTCTARVYTAGQAFIDSGQGHVHIARNESSTEGLELWAVYFDVPPGGAFRIDAAAPGTCPF